jgi:hypothetical protein
MNAPSKLGARKLVARKLVMLKKHFIFPRAFSKWEDQPKRSAVLALKYFWLTAAKSLAIEYKKFYKFIFSE